MHCFAYFQAIAPPVDQNPALDYPDVLSINFLVAGGTNADFLDANRMNTTLTDLQDMGNWNTTGTTSLTLSITDFTNQMIVLPVDWLSFSGKVVNEDIVLIWQTATETDNEFFAVEHSRDGRHFQQIGKIDGQGTTLEVSDYDFTHHKPTPGANYYRIRQVDFDGAMGLSDVIVLQVKDERSSTRLYPNPIEDRLSIDWSSLSANDFEAEEIEIGIYNVNGQLVRSLLFDFTIGNTNTDLSFLPNGFYTLITKADGQVFGEPQRLIKS